MPWLRSGDNAASHPIVMRVWALVARCADTVLERDVAVNEVFGFVTRCALQSAGHTTDYLIDDGTAYMLGLARTDRLLELARKAGYIKRVPGQQAWRLVDDPEFLHMRLRAEIEWEKQQRADSSNPALTVPVRLRDGDACRYCARVVNFRARKGQLAGTYDHREPGKAGSVATLVVACGACNAGRRDDPDADLRYPLRPAPPLPYYSTATVEWLAAAGHTVTAPTDDLRPGTQLDHANSDPATSGTTRQPPQRRAPVGSADRLPTGSGFAGSGRVGSGNAPNPSGSDARASPVRRRSRRGRPR